MAERKQYKIIGQRGTLRRYGWTKAAGTAIYTRDVRRPGMLFAKAMRNPYGHARIKSMDTSKAEAYPGVRGILRYDDPEVVNSGHAEILMNESWHEAARSDASSQLTPSRSPKKRLNWSKWNGKYSPSTLIWKRPLTPVPPFFIQTTSPKATSTSHGSPLSWAVMN